MDIEPPHHPIATKRDFFLHLFTITCGLLIALSLESLVEWGHHRALVREARENIRRELEDDKKATGEDIKNVQEDENRFIKNLETVRRLKANPSARGLQFQSNFSWSSTSDSAWRTARDTGALAYMPYAEVQRYAEIYNQQEITNTEAIRLFRQQTEAVGPFMMVADKANPPQEELTNILRSSAVVAVDLRTLGQILTQQRDQYTIVLQAR